MPTKTTPTPCSLCSLPTPEPPIRGRGELSAKRYCCSGCATVDEILHHLSERERLSAMLEIGRRVGLPDEQLAALEAAASRGGVDPKDQPGSAKGEESTVGVVEHRFRVSGLQCPSCTWLVEHVLSKQPGVLEAHADFMTEIGTVRLDLRKTSRETAVGALEAVGYKAVDLDDRVDVDPERLLLRFGVGAIVAMNAMMLAFVHYAELVGAGSGQWKVVVGALGACITIPALAYCGAPIFRRAFALASHGRLAMESLLVLGILASVGISLSAFVLPGADFYFEIPAMIVATALGSRLVDRAIRRVGARKVADLLRPRPRRVRVASEGGMLAGFVDLDELDVGHRVVVAVGEEVPADVMVAGETVSVSEAVLSGEPRPVLKRAGATVLAGSEVIEGALLGDVIRPASASAHAQIGQQILDVVRGQGERMAMADRLAAVFVLIVLAVALGTIFGYVVFGGHELSSPSAWLPAIAVLVVACPCAFSIAASASMGTAAIRLLTDGVLLRNPVAFEQAASADVVVFDKTGTLTTGDMEVHALEWLGEPDPALLGSVLAIESGSRHPMAIAIRRFLSAEGVTAPPEGEVTSIDEHRGLGVRGVIGGRDVAVGAPDIFENADDIPELDDEGIPRPAVFFGSLEQPAGRFVFDDPLRPSAFEAVERLRRLGVDSELLSGDDEAVVARVAEELGIGRREGRVLPRDKAAHVETLREAGRKVIYVGDGLNDAPALAAATVGISMRHGASMTLETADLLSVRDEPTAAAQTIVMSRRLKALTAQNYVWAIAYNVVLVPVAAVGWLHPAFAALAMLLSSLTVLANSARLLRGSGV